ncbi:ATP-binding protein [Nocardia flavorosea]|uniref:methylation-associated defense system ATP-binding protein MAD8 n=1 Tax=Nocardia flavorosea TaxID=53429 RepID=UPI001893AE72|nr:ATP-binding protein [Nocardia flavorosea]MBF6352875.1 ATP-binding protein [Nocardia flavorosea]
MSEGLRELTDRDLDEALEQLLVPKLTSVLLSRENGHCARVTELSAALATGVCAQLQAAAGTRAHVYVLGRPPGVPESVAVTSTKLIELRNPDEDGRRPPLLVLIPPGTRASAEDSFDIATFEQIELGDVYGDLAGRLFSELPAELHIGVKELFSVLDENAWLWANSYARARYLLTVKLNEYDLSAAGAALFELGLIPDFDLFDDAAEVRTRLTRNVQQMGMLTTADRPTRQRVIRLGLTESSFRARLADFLVNHGTEDPRAWTRRIVVDRANWPLAFPRWPLREDSPANDRMTIRVKELDLPTAGSAPEHAQHPTLSAITGQPYLLGGSKGVNQLAAEFEVDPDPRTIAALEKFTVQLIAEQSGFTGLSVSTKVNKTAKAAKRSYKAALKRLRAAELDDGWYFLRVLPIDEDGVPLPVVPDRNGARPRNESERFYIVSDEALDDPAPSTRISKDVGVSQAIADLAFKAVTDGKSPSVVSLREVGWRDGKTTLHAAFSNAAQVEIPLSPTLVELERSTLASPGNPGQWKIAIRNGVPATPTAVEHIWPASGDEAMTNFLRTRTQLFRAIRGDEDLVVEGRDLRQFHELVIEYAESYGELLNRQLYQNERADDSQLRERLRELTGLLQIDTITVDHIDTHGLRTQIILTSPTHPLRLLWLATWAELGHEWREAAADVDVTVRAATAASHRLMSPLGFPLVVPRADGRMAVAASNLTPYWGVCLPADVADPQRLLSLTATALTVARRGGDGDVVDGRRLADRIERYLRLHPYVGTLVVNAVNPGGADALADMLLVLESRRGLKGICYELRLFSSEPESTTEGSALSKLLRGEWRDTLDAETFRAPRAAGTGAKLTVAIRPLDEFRSATSENNAHITFLFDAFSNEDFGAIPASNRGTVPVHGLVQDVTVTYTDDGDTVLWQKQPRHGSAHSLARSDELTDLLSSLPEVVSNAACAVATRQVGTRMVPNIGLTLDAADNTLLHQAHQSSDWVITIDRTLGIEYFDSPHSSRRSDYVIDVEESGREGLGHHVVTTSRSIDELSALLTPVIEQHHLQIDSRHTRTFFDQLRLLSGRLALKIASAAANQRTEVLGLALARLFLDYQGVLANQILVPLDSHLELYRDARRSDQIGESVSLQRTDLALFSLDARERKIVCRLVEVKCYSSVSHSLYDEMKSRIADQIERSASVLAEHFDPYLTQPDRPDRVVRNAEFAAMLRSYLDRAVRYDTMGTKPAAEARWLLDRLDREPPCRLEFTRTGLIFDLSTTGISNEIEDGIEFHRVGRDLVQQLIDAIPTKPAEPAHSEATPSLSSLRSMELTVPRLVAAEFRAPARRHDVPADDIFEERMGDKVENDPQTPPQDDVEPTDDSADRPDPEEVTTGTTQSVEAEPILPAPRGETLASTSIRNADIFLGSVQSSPQYAVIGETAGTGKTVALDLNETHTISLFGVQGGGKSYTLGTIIEAASLAHPPVNQLPNPLATIVFHYSPTLDYAPEFTSMVNPNSAADQTVKLRERYGVEPTGLDDVVMLVPEDQLADRLAEYPGIQVLPLKFGSSELRAEHWRFLMGAIGNQSTYIRQLQRIMKSNRNDLRLDAIRTGIDSSSLTDNLKQLAHQRLDLAAEYIDDHARVKTLVKPGRMIIVDLRDEFIEKDEALGLFVVLMQLFAEARNDGARFNKLVVFDEAHKYIESPDLIAGLVESVREMRHKGMSVLVASQDPPSVPISLIELSDHIFLHKFTSPAWLKHIQKANAALADLSPSKLANLTQGEAWVWASKATDQEFTRKAVKVRLRPRVTQHGGGTKTAVE